jgi:hypothetical protein
MTELVVHQVNIAHYRLIELTRLADQAKPFYDWVERQAKRITGSHKPLSEILLSCSETEVRQIVLACYLDERDEKPFLFDGIGRVYPHAKACFYFFAWMIRDAPQQRLAPLITRMQRLDQVPRLTAQADALVGLIVEYRTAVRSFEWQAIREIVVDRLEGSRRSISGHHSEANVRTGLITAIQHFYSVYGNYGRFRRVEIASTQIKAGRHTIDISAELTPRQGTQKTNLLILVKTRETEGGGHAHLFTRDLATAINDIKVELEDSHIVVVIVAENWSGTEIETLGGQIDKVFHFNMSSNRFVGFDDVSQIEFNKYVAEILGGVND